MNFMEHKQFILTLFVGLVSMFLGWTFSKDANGNTWLQVYRVFREDLTRGLLWSPNPWYNPFTRKWAISCSGGENVYSMRTGKGRYTDQHSGGVFSDMSFDFSIRHGKIYRGLGRGIE